MKGHYIAAILIGVVSMMSSQEASAASLKSYAADPPISFIYGGKPSAELMKDWKPVRASEKIDKQRTRRTATYLDPQTKLQVKIVSVEYHDFPTVEWTAYFKNTGAADTPILDNIKALNTNFERGKDGEFVLHHNKGTSVRADDYEPLTTTLAPGSKTDFAPVGGRSCALNFPFFNVEWPGGGMIIAVGWPGQWSTQFERNAGSELAVRAGQETTHMTLRPGEEIRTPLMVLQSYEGDWWDAQNVWRKWMVAYNIPRPGGKLPPVQLNACSSHQYAEMINANEENQMMFVDRYAEEKLGLDYWWMDAGWYPTTAGWWMTGTWEVDKARFPNGLRSISDHARTKGMKTIVWFEPERVHPGTWLYEKHPEWLLPVEGDSLRLLNMGNPEALKWVTDHVNDMIDSQGIDLYRQDYNIDPLRFWRASDTPDRQGMTENAYVQGYLAYWDGLLKKHPNLLIDTCASGGHRNDLETLRRSVPLLRSDYIFEPKGQQGHTYGMSYWVPYFGTGLINVNTYELRSSMCYSFTCAWDMRNKDLDYGLLRTLISQWRGYAPNFLGDYYPLTPYSLEDTAWIAWQFNSPKKGQGMVQAFRRAENADATANYKLKGLNAKARYEVRDLDAPAAQTLTGRELMDEGLTVSIPGKPGAAVVTYKQVK